ncbi:hypothetical protein D9613_012641 [Agrocybe pediades]|uniref:Uncharacterized protein n=1 Tax=Agrocybe pediades TaxID=84607 RepID=A0A8H4QWR2_9AGAR|nr:hypothetical protein D9613_012641 [Agrocybe pediades]
MGRIAHDLDQPFESSVAGSDRDATLRSPRVRRHRMESDRRIRHRHGAETLKMVDNDKDWLVGWDAVAIRWRQAIRRLSLEIVMFGNDFNAHSMVRAEGYRCRRRTLRIYRIQQPTMSTVARDGVLCLCNPTHLNVSANPFRHPDHQALWTTLGMTASSCDHLFLLALSGPALRPSHSPPPLGMVAIVAIVQKHHCRAYWSAELNTFHSTQVRRRTQSGSENERDEQQAKK